MILIIVDFLYFGALISMIQIIIIGGEESRRGLKLKSLKPDRLVNMTAGTTKGAVISNLGPQKKRKKKSSHPVWTEQELAVAEELPIWVNPPRTIAQVFTFPHPINDAMNRCKGAIVCILVLLSIILDLTVDVPYIYIYVCFGYFCRVICGPRLNLETWFIILLSPIIKKYAPPEYVPGPPKRFAQLCGFSMSFAVVIIRFVFHAKEVAYWVASALVTAIALEALYGICLGCIMFKILMLSKLVPERTCYKCRMLFQARDDANSDISMTLSTDEEDVPERGLSSQPSTIIALDPKLTEESTKKKPNVVVESSSSSDESVAESVAESVTESLGTSTTESNLG